MYSLLLGIPAVEALQKGLTDLQELFEHVLHTFQVQKHEHNVITQFIVIPLIILFMNCVHNETALFGDHLLFFFITFFQGSVDNFRQHEQLLSSSQEE